MNACLAPFDSIRSCFHNLSLANCASTLLIQPRPAPLLPPRHPQERPLANPYYPTLVLLAQGAAQQTRRLWCRLDGV